MAVMTVNTACRDEEPLQTRVPRGFRAQIDAFVTSRMKHAVSKAESLHEGKCGQQESFVQTPDRAETPGVELQPLREDILSATIPAFFIGRNKAGLWIAREVRGRIGGMFLLKRSALAFARTQSETARCAFIFPSERFELDLENRGNPLAGHAESLLRIAAGWRRIAACALTAGLALFALAGIIALKAAIYVHVWRLPL